jgi:hypothetical protein
MNRREHAALSVTDGCRFGAGDGAFSHVRFRSQWSILLTSEKFNEGRKPTSVAIRFTEHPNEVPVAKRSSHGRLLSTLSLPNLGDELGSHTVCREYIPMYDLLAADIGRHGIPVQIKAINGGVAVHAESLSPFWGGSGPPTRLLLSSLTSPNVRVIYRITV